MKSFLFKIELYIMLDVTYFMKSNLVNRTFDSGMQKEKFKEYNTFIQNALYFINKNFIFFHIDNFHYKLQKEKIHKSSSIINPIVVFACTTAAL